MKVITIPKPILKHRLRVVLAFRIKNGAYQALVDDMRQTMVTAKGVGLAANQVEQDLMLFVIEKRLAEENSVPDAFFNPEITEYARQADEMEEGCLSIPGLFVPVSRPKKIMFKALDEKGDKIKFRARGFLARVLQHEVDHLNGLTIKDRVK